MARRLRPSVARDQPSVAPGIAWKEFGGPALLIFVIAIVVRVIHLWQIHGSLVFTMLMGDARAYDHWAQEIARGDWIGRTVFYQAPLYAYLLGGLYAAAGRHLMLVRLCQAVIGSVSCVLLGLAGWRFFSRAAGLAAGLALALYAPAIFFDSLLQKSFLDAFFICLMLWIVSELRRRRDGRVAPWLGLGLMLGGLSLTRENGLVFVLVVLVWIALGGGRRAGRARTAGVFLLGLAIVLLPVAVRNGAVGGAFYLTTSQFGPNFYIGNNPTATGAYMPLREGRGSAEYERDDATTIAEHAAGRRLTPREVSRFWTARALAFIDAQPGAWLHLLWTKLGLLWNANEIMDTEAQERYADWSVPLRVLGAVGHFGVIVPLAVFGVWATWPERRRIWILYLMVGAYAASVVMFFVFARYRYPLVPFLLLFASAGAVRAARVVKTAPRRQLALVAAAVFVIAVFVNRPRGVSTDLMRAITESNLGQALETEGRNEEAIEHYRQAIAFSPDWAPPYNNIGAALRAEAKEQEAIAFFEQALRIQPNYPKAQHNLALALLATDRAEDAIPHLQQALRSMGDAADAHRDLGVAFAKSGRADEAISEFRAAFELRPEDTGVGADSRLAGAHLALGNVYRGMGRIEEAAGQYREAVRIAPDAVEAHTNLGALLAEQGRTDEALAELQMGLRYDPHSSVALTNLGIILRKQGKREEAVAALRQAVAVTPDVPETRQELGLALIEAGEQQAAIEHLERTVELRPGSAQAHNDLGVALTGAGRLDEAIRQFREALRLDPNLPDAQYDLHVALGMQDAAAGRAATAP